MRIALVADAYPPLRSSGAVQLRDLSQEFLRQGHDVTVMVSAPDLPTPWAIDNLEGVRVLRLATLPTKDIGYVRRTVGEVLLSTMMLRGLRCSPLAGECWDAVVWYSPTIFLGRFVGALKKACGARTYLILRDVFPEWAVDMGLLRRGLLYRFFKHFEHLQYEVADVIGVQSPSNLGYLSEWSRRPGRRLEVLQNWLAPAANAGCSIEVARTPLMGRRIVVYAGNMGVAQGMDMVIGLAQRMRRRPDIGFLFVGRGSDVLRLKALASEHRLGNVMFHDEIEPREVPGLLAQADVGLVMLDPRHKTHNVPGKFITYMQAGVPVLARVNEGNDLADLIASEGVGQAYVGDSVEAFYAAALAVCDAPDKKAMADRAKHLADRLYSSRAAVKQIVSSLSQRD